MTKFYLSSLLVLGASILFYVFSINGIFTDYFNHFFPPHNKDIKFIPTNTNADEMAEASDASWKNAQTIYEFTANNIDNQPIDLSHYK
jgi:hypothetical protein